MLILKINFSDFWSGFNKTDNFIYNLLIKKYDVEISSHPEFLFFSCFGVKNLSYTNCKKIFFTGENIRPDFTGADYCITFDYNFSPRHYRFPFWPLWIKPDFLLQPILNPEDIIKSKTKFCGMLVSYCRSQKRKDIFHLLSQYKRVDSGGKCLNNLGGRRIENKYDFFKDYKFILAFENASYPGYSTEKIFDVLSVNSVPLYWGDTELYKEINPKKYISLHNFSTEKEFIDYVIEVDNNDELYFNYIKEPFLINHQLPDYCDMSLLGNFIFNIIEDNQPSSRTFMDMIKHLPRNYGLKFRINRTFGLS